MEASTLILLLVGLITGFAVGFLIKRSSEKVLRAQLNQERGFQEEARQALSKSQADFQAVQDKKIQYETQYQECIRQLADQKNELQSLKETLTKSNQSILQAEALKTKAATELSEAQKRILDVKAQAENQLSEIRALQRELSETKATNASLLAKYQEALKAVEEQKNFLKEAQNTLRESFSSLSSVALRSNNQSFLDLAKTALDKQLNDSKTDLEKRQQAIDALVNPLRESLTNFNGKAQEIEKNRQGAYEAIKVFLDGVKGTTEKLQKETNSLVAALKTSHTRGKYGEIGLKRVVEFAGMSAYCDFEEQVSVTTEEGRLRPDLIVNLPGQRKVIVDAKVPLAAYMQAFEIIDENEKNQLLKKHALAVREHLKQLSAKAYWSQFSNAPDYVIMYLQIESSFGAALEIDRTLIEDALNNRIIFATPTTLITMLRTIAFSWQQVSISENIYQIRDAGVELYNRAVLLIQHIGALGNNLNAATQNYNKIIGSLENRFLPQAKRLKEMGGTLMGKNIPDTNTIDTAIRDFNNEAGPNDPAQDNE